MVNIKNRNYTKKKIRLLSVSSVFGKNQGTRV